MESWIEFGRGPLFRFAFSLMVLGLVRILLLTLIGLREAYQRNRDKIVAWREVARQTLLWLFPMGRLWKRRPIYSSVSLLFHVGLLAVPLFLAAHANLWRREVGFAWAALPRTAANWLTVLVIVTGLGLFFGRLFCSGGRKLSRPQDYAWPLLLAVPFVTGYTCSNAAIGSKTYQVMMVIHVYVANLIMMLIPFSKIAHCVLTPMSQLVTAIAWKFPAGAGDRVAATLGYADRPVWAERSRMEPGTPPQSPANTGIYTE